VPGTSTPPAEVNVDLPGGGVNVKPPVIEVPDVKIELPKLPVEPPAGLPLGQG